MINMYFGLENVDEYEIDDKNHMVKTITVGAIVEWPRDQQGMSSKVISTKYAILHKIVMTNWLAFAHRGSLSLKFVELLYRIGQRISLNLGDLIYHQIMSFTDLKDPKVNLHYPSLIFSILNSSRNEALQL